MKSEREKMITGARYRAMSAELVALRKKTRRTLHKLNVTEYYSDTFQQVINELCPNAASNLHLEPPFHCDYGDLIYAGKHVFINFDCVILDGGTVTIGDNTMIAPGVHIYAAGHPVNIMDRKTWEVSLPVVIGRDCWIGGRSTILGGVTIGERVVVGAGSVVNRDVPDDSLVVGNPARVVKKLNQNLTPEDRALLMDDSFRWKD